MNMVFIRTLIAALSLLGVAARADSTVSTSPCPNEPSFTCVNGISNLTIAGASYDLAVVVGTFTSHFTDPSNQLLSWGNQTFAQAANVAISDTLNSLLHPTDQDTKFFDSGAQPRYEYILHLPVDYSFGNPVVGFNGPCAVIVDWGVSAGGCGNWQTDEVLAFGVLTSVPEPATALLFAIGLFAFSLMRVRTAQTTRSFPMVASPP